MKRASLRLSGKVLYLTEDTGQLRQQLAGELSLKHGAAGKLIDNISTDELTPGWVCYYYDETLARYCLIGLRGGVIDQGRHQAGGGFQVIVSGRSKGCGSSRETAPYAELARRHRAGRGPRTIEKIYGQNAREHRPAHHDRLRRPRAARARRRDHRP